jgi:hypothetical protein
MDAPWELRTAKLRPHRRIVQPSLVISEATCGPPQAPDTPAVRLTSYATRKLAVASRCSGRHRYILVLDAS